MRHLLALLFLAPALALAQAPSRVATTLSGLLAMKPGETQPHVQVLGFSSPGDWGPPKTFRYDATNALATNAIRRATALGSGRWVHDWDGDVRAFGVKADGATDDTTATQAAIDYASDNGVTLILPSGYRTSLVAGLVITNNSVIEGPDKMLAASSSLNSREQNRWIWRLKPNANTWILRYTAGQHSLSGVTLDGNKAQGNSNNVPLLWIDMGLSSYKESTWSDINVFNGAGDGIWNFAHSPTFRNVMAQRNDGNGIVITNGYDSFVYQSYFGANGLNGIYAVNHGSIRWDKVDSFQNRGRGFHLLNVYLGFGSRLIANLNLKDGILLDSDGAIAAGYVTFDDCQFLLNNYPTDVFSVASPEADGAWSNLRATGSAAHFPYIFSKCRLYLAENGLVKRPKFLVESDATGTLNFSGSVFDQCLYTSNTNFFRSATPFSGAILSTASFTASRDQQTSRLYSYHAAGDMTLGSSLTATNPLTLQQAGGSMIKMNRTGLPQSIEMTVGFRSLILNETTANNASIATFENNGTPIWFLGSASGGASPRNGTISTEPASSGTDTPSRNLILRAGPGTGAGTGGGAINFQTPSTHASGSVVQTNYTRLQILQDGALFMPVVAQPGAPTDGLFYRGTNSNYPGTTNWFFARTNGWVPLP